MDGLSFKFKEFNYLFILNFFNFFYKLRINLSKTRFYHLSLAKYQNYFSSVPSSKCYYLNRIFYRPHPGPDSALSAGSLYLPPVWSRVFAPVSWLLREFLHFEVSGSRFRSNWDLRRDSGVRERVLQDFKGNLPKIGKFRRKLHQRCPKSAALLISGSLAKSTTAAPTNISIRPHHSDPLLSSLKHSNFSTTWYYPTTLTN